MPEPAEPEALLSVRKLRRVFTIGDAKVEAVRDVDLDIHEGDFVAVVGPSGSGKSTLLHLLGLIDSPTEGEVLLRGEAASHLGRETRAGLRLRWLGFVFQTFNLLQLLTARQNVEIALRLAGVPKRARRERAESLLTAVGLGARMRHRPVQLSGGERQRVAIARALANEPAVLLADEPTGNLDSGTGLEIVSLLERLNQAGQTIVMVTHNMEIASRATRLLHMRDGHLVEDGDELP
ncbi:MAG TPA: ABC transporter ATP-binding protein [Dehalococcoidia bacterium]|nr:ABC transporter ATP-binding protein [Dehalococcoidia bacterium]